MERKLVILIVLSLVIFCTPAVAELKVADAVITTAIEKQMPVDQIEVYPADYGKLFCFTRVVGASKETHVTHIWYYQDDELARVELPIGSADWRTYSSKRFLPQWGGKWRVVVADEEGHEIATVPFTLE